MSGAHARLRRDGRRWLLEDLGSRNGTRVDGKPVAHLALSDGDVVEAGHALLLFREALHGPPGGALDFDTRTATFPARGLGTVLPALASEIESLVRIAASPVPVLLRGETGTGKEVVARAVHALSRRDGPFVAVNCGAIPGALVESHLFGHTRGAFSGAARDEPGFVRASSGGTLFLDEIGDLPATSQSALLRVLQEGEVVPVGSTRAVPVDLRVVAATHQPLEALVARGAFRTDLLARLDGFTFTLPALRERREDMGLLVGDLLGAMPEGASLRLSPEVGRALIRYDWPQNVRELGHCLARACALARGEEALELRHLPPQVRDAVAETPPAERAPDDAATEESRLRAQLEGLLREHEGNIAEVARALGKARMQVHRWLKRFQIDPDRYRR
jgi:transcriptional regulator with PAS, ATPase and Fis domain